MSRVGGAPPFKNYFIGRASSGRNRNLRSKILTPSSLCSLLEIAHFVKLGATPKELAALTSRSSLNIELTLSHISEETLESLKLCERNSRVSNNPRANQATTEGHPQSDVTQRHAEFLQATQRHFKLKASIKQNL